MTRLGSARWTSVAAVAALLSIVATTLFARPAAAYNVSYEMAGASFELAAVDLAFVRMVSAEQALLDLTNADRISNGLPALDFDPETLLIARQRAEAQLRADNLSHYDEHGLLAFVSLLDQSALRYGLAGENLARSKELGTNGVQRIEEALMKSPTHRTNILEKRFSRAAIGMASDASGRVAFAEIFRGE
ncbi:MAG TPA: CAP domain-containing protein [Chloroflexota bacterium]|jgi:uncharacterized protein YkwD